MKLARRLVLTAATLAGAGLSAAQPTATATSATPAVTSPVTPAAAPALPAAASGDALPPVDVLFQDRPPYYTPQPGKQPPQGLVIEPLRRGLERSRVRLTLIRQARRRRRLLPMLGCPIRTVSII